MNLINNPLFSKILKSNTAKKIQANTTVRSINFKKQHCKNLQHSLKQLEFISCFEMHLDKKNIDSYSLSFLQELAKIKQLAEENTLQSIKYCKAS